MLDLSRFLPRSLLALAVASISAASARDASANGRFPASNQVASTTANPSLIVARTTFGLLISRDGGVTFDWICEQAIGYGGTQDPGLAVMADGSLLVAAFEGLSVSHDGGCSWTLEKKYGLANEYVIDAAAETLDPSRAVIITSTGLGIGNFHSEVYRTADNAKTWASVGTALDSDILAETVDVAPSDPMRLYVSGQSGVGAVSTGVVATSKDGGKVWTRVKVDLGTDQQIFIAGVDPTDADRFYLRTLGNTDRLIVSKDGGKTFTPVVEVTRPLSGFAVSPDGMTLLLGGPDVGWTPGSKPLDAVERRPAILSAKRDDLTFAAVAQVTTGCLGWVGGSLLACGDGFADGFVIARSTTGSPPLVPILPGFLDIRGPIACPASAPTTKTCAPLWPAFRAMFGPPPSSTGAGGGAGASAPASGDGGGGCATSTSGSSYALAAVGLVALLSLARRRIG